MAKLHGVKVIDMVGGEVTKIAYEGAEYTKVEGGNVLEGDLVTTSVSLLDVTIGEYYEVNAKDNYDDYSVKDDIGDIRSNLSDFTIFRKVNAQPCEQPSASLADEVQALDQRVTKLEADAKPALVCGDYARVTEESHVANGKVVKIIDINYSDIFPYDTEYLNGQVGDCFVADQLEKLSDEEVAEAQAQAAEVAKWAKIGRKPGEFKKGDIAEVLEVYGGSREVGDMFEVMSKGCGYPVDNAGTIYYVGSAGDTVKLITPVEHRFDKTEGQAVE